MSLYYTPRRRGTAPLPSGSCSVLQARTYFTFMMALFHAHNTLLAYIKGLLMLVIDCFKSYSIE